MKLWLISQSVNQNWDTYDSAVVAAETKEEARHIYPDNYGENDKYWDGSTWRWNIGDYNEKYTARSWTAPCNVSVQFLADGYEGPAGCILASFNAG